MNKREISEIKKQFKKDNNAITRICGCYVDAEKQIKTTLKEAFFALSEEEIFKYYEIFKKSLSGGIGKNLHNLEYSIHDEGPDSAHELLMKLRDEKLADDGTVDTFYNKVIENYEYGENYYIILIHSAYDVPGKASDNEEMFDASEEVYNHILCCICPVKLSEPGLSYNEATNAIEERPRDWWVQTPMTDSCSRPSTTAAAISTASCISPGIRRSFTPSSLTPASAHRHRSPSSPRKKRSRRS